MSQPSPGKTPGNDDARGPIVRPLEPNELDILWANWESLYGPSFEKDEGARSRMKERVLRSGTLRDGILDLGIELDGKLIGEIGARSIAMAMPPGVFELGLGIFDPALRGRGYGTEAVLQLTDRLFRDEGAGRAQASTATGNRGMRRALEKAGYRHEGTLRGFWPAGKVREDYALYATTLADWRKRPSMRPGA